MAAMTDNVSVKEGSLLASAVLRVVDVPHAVSLYRFVDEKGERPTHRDHGRHRGRLAAAGPGRRPEHGAAGRAQGLDPARTCPSSSSWPRSSSAGAAVLLDKHKVGSKKNLSIVYMIKKGTNLNLIEKKN